MTIAHKLMVAVTVSALMTGCAGVPVALGTRTTGPVPTGPTRVISSEACGFQLLLFFPIMINNRLERAYGELEGKAGGDFITDVKVEENWAYGFVGTSHCTALQAKAIHVR